MSPFRKKLARAVSKGAPEPTDSPFYGGIVHPDQIREIEATNPSMWLRKRPERGVEVNEENYPEAWAAGRELAKGAYARRLREAQPIPREPEATKVAGLEALNTTNLLPLALGSEEQRSELAADGVDSQAITACATAYAITTRHLFSDHWNSD